MAEFVRLFWKASLSPPPAVSGNFCGVLSSAWEMWSLGLAAGPVLVSPRMGVLQLGGSHPHGAISYFPLKIEEFPTPQWWGPH